MTVTEQAAGAYRRAIRGDSQGMSAQRVLVVPFQFLGNGLLFDEDLPADSAEGIPGCSPVDPNHGVQGLVHGPIIELGGEKPLERR